MANENQLLECPMCDFAVLPTDEYIIQLHFEQVHTTNSPFVVTDGCASPDPPSLSSNAGPNRKHTGNTLSSDEEAKTVECTDPDCGELVLLSDFNDHLDYHAAETLSFDETTGTYHSHPSSADMQDSPTTHHPSTGFAKQQSLDPHSNVSAADTTTRNGVAGRKIKKHGPRNRSDTTSSEKSTLSRSILAFNPFAKFDKTVKPPSKTGRLGKLDLGPYAWEDRMPKWLHDQLEAGPKVTAVNRISRDGHLIKQEQVQNETPGLLPILAQLSALDRSVKEAYYCHPSTLHIGKTPKEGSFCGYRNIQMLLSYIQGAKAQGHEEFPGRTPGILKLQDLIERAWDKGINAIGRVQTGGIRDTRKYIGTPEAQAFFLSSEISCAVEMFSDNETRGTEAHETLLKAIERYFSQAAVADGSNVYKTLLPPIYLQQPGHSLTIIGFERRRDDSCNLIVFDPMYHTSPAMHKLVGRRNIRSARPEVLHAYRRGARQLRKHAASEVLILTATPPLFPAWDVLRQFPDCRYVYAFFRSRTLGYDVYPEDYFLRNFPWHHYGGLWICDEARFARAEPISAHIAQSLRSMTGNGGSSRSSQNESPISPFTSHSFQHLPATDAHMRSGMYAGPPSYLPSFDGLKREAEAIQQNFIGGLISHMSATGLSPLQSDAVKPKLSLLTDVGRKYPGFPTPLSPTPSAIRMFPSPRSDLCSEHASLVTNNSSPSSMNGCDLLQFSSRNPSGNCACSPDIQQSSVNPLLRVPPTPPRSMTASTSPRSPSISISPRTAMLKNIATKQALQNLSYNPMFCQAQSLQFYPSAVNACMTPRTSSVQSDSSGPCSKQFTYTRPSIQIANGTETNTTSPIDPSGTMLLYTSNRNVDSGLLGVPPLTEAQVAEYRFWRPCGRRQCAFGCGDAHEGEWAAAKRLFKSVEEIKFDDEESLHNEQPIYPSLKFGSDGQVDNSSTAVEYAMEEAKFSSSIWAGRRLVTNWNRFLMTCEREGVARF